MKIKNFETYINEDYFSKLANRKDNGNVRMENEITEDFVRSFLFDDSNVAINSITIRKENGKTIVDVDGDFAVDVTVEEIPFQFGTVSGGFNCAACEKLKSLVGCQYVVGGDFSCIGCKRITSLEGCPEKVGGYFDCSECKKIKSLEGCPEKVGGSFFCSSCVGIESLEFCPEKVYGMFDCSHCGNLTSLKGCPKEVNGGFYCKNCGKKFTSEDVTKICNVKGEIAV